MMGVEPSTPLYVASHWPTAEPDLADSILGKLREARYTVVTSRDLPPRLAWRLDSEAFGDEQRGNSDGSRDGSSSRGSSMALSSGSGRGGDKGAVATASSRRAIIAGQEGAVVQAGGAADPWTSRRGSGGHGEADEELPRELFAQVEYALALASDRFIGELLCIFLFSLGGLFRCD